MHSRTFMEHCPRPVRADAAGADLRQTQERQDGTLGGHPVVRPRGVGGRGGRLGFGGRGEVKLGVHNLFENYPDKARFETCCGIVYRTDSIVPWQGRLLYLRVGVRFD